MRAGHPLYKFIAENMHRGGSTAILKTDLLKVIQEWCDEGHLLYKKARPETINNLNDTIRICNGTIDERYSFLLHTPDEISRMIKESTANQSMNTILRAEESHCYVLPWIWKEDSKYRNQCRRALRAYPKSGYLL